MLDDEAANGFRLSLRSAGMTAAQSRRRDDALIHFFIATPCFSQSGHCQKTLPLREVGSGAPGRCLLANSTWRLPGAPPVFLPRTDLAVLRDGRLRTSKPPFSAAGFFQGPDLGLVTRQRHR